MKDKSVIIPIEYEYLLSHLFGKQNYHAVTGSNNINFLKKTYNKIFRSIKRAIELNIVSCDEVLIDDLTNICNYSLLELKQNYTAELLNIKMSTYLTKIVFILIGQFPQNWNKHKTNFNKEWFLNKYRTINYTSNYQQRCFLIIDNYNKYSDPSRHPKIDKLWDKLNYDFKNDHAKFVKWFKESYFEIYRKII